jgi:hypothetical protein
MDLMRWGLSSSLSSRGAGVPLARAAVMSFSFAARISSCLLVSAWAIASRARLRCWLEDDASLRDALWARSASCFTCDNWVTPSS